MPSSRDSNPANYMPCGLNMKVHIPAVVEFHFIASNEDEIVLKDPGSLVEEKLQELEGQRVGGIHRPVDVGRFAMRVLAIGQQPGMPEFPRFRVAYQKN